MLYTINNQEIKGNSTSRICGLDLIRVASAVPPLVLCNRAALLPLVVWGGGVVQCGPHCNENEYEYENLLTVNDETAALYENDNEN